MQLDYLISEITNEIWKYIRPNDFELAQEFLSHNGIDIAIEFICDKLSEYNKPIPEKFGKILQVASGKLNIMPKRSWKTLLIEEETYQLKRMMEVYASTSKENNSDFDIDELFNEARRIVSPNDLYWVEEHLKYGELELSLDELFSCLIQDKIPVSKEYVNKLLCLWLDLDQDPADWKGFTFSDDIAKNK